MRPTGFVSGVVGGRSVGYRPRMPLEQCSAVVLHGRDSTGNRGGLVPPRRCRRPSTQGDYCGLHAKQADVQDLLRDCLSPMWESRVRRWEERRRRRQVDEARVGVAALGRGAHAAGLGRLELFFRLNRDPVAEAWVAQGRDRFASV